MPRRALGSIQLNRQKRAPLQAQLMAQLKLLLQRGELAGGDALPSSRDLAVDLRVSRNTVLAAYDQLVSEGYFEARPRSGLYVSSGLTAVPRGEKAIPPGRPAAPRLAGPTPFRPCQPDVRLFPLTLWNRLRGRVLRAQGNALLNYHSRLPLGWPALQRELAIYLRDSRGVRCQPEQIAITTGSQQALFLLSLLLLKRGTPVYVEDPGYLGVRSVIARTGARLIPVPVDAHGAVPPAKLLPGALFYTTPSRQFPTGATLPVARRLALLQAARASEAWILEDDYDSEFRYTRAPLPSLHSLDEAGRVIYLGTVSKVLCPALRIGYAVLPQRWVEPFAELRAAVEDHGPFIDQATLAEFLATGAFYTHIRRCRKAYAERLAAFLEAARGLPLDFPHTDGGMNLMGLWTGEPRAAEATLARHGLDVPAIERYALRSSPRGLLFGFTAFDRPAIRAGVRRLALALEQPLHEA